MAFDGDLEIHITVADGGGNLAGLPAVAASLGWKYLRIELSRGETVSQPMLTRHVKGDLNAAKQAANDVVNVLNATGFSVTRTKIEAAPWNTDVPQTDADAVPERHFEAHIKLLLPPNHDTTALVAVAVRHGAHLSRNAFKHRADGHAERFVTVRAFGVGADTAKTRVAALLAGVAPLGFPVLDAEEEYVIFDSNLSVDNGWLTPQETTQ